MFMEYKSYIFLVSKLHKNNGKLIKKMKYTSINIFYTQHS